MSWGQSYNRTATPETPASQPPIRRAKTDPRSGWAEGHPVRTPQREPWNPLPSEMGCESSMTCCWALGALATNGDLETPCARSRPHCSGWKCASLARGQRPGSRPVDAVHGVSPATHGLGRGGEGLACLVRLGAPTARATTDRGAHTFLATRITAYLSNGAPLDHRQEPAGAEAPSRSAGRLAGSAPADATRAAGPGSDGFRLQARRESRSSPSSQSTIRSAMPSRRPGGLRRGEYVDRRRRTRAVSGCLREGAILR